MTLAAEHRMTRASLGKRFLAGLIDFLLLALLCLLAVALPMLLRGLVVPMWGVLLVIIGYAVVPLAFLKKTLGMWIYGLELATKDGHAVDLANVAFRELIGRGYFPAAFLYTVLAGLIARVLGVAAFVMPTGLAAVMILASAFTCAGALIGHLLALNRQDQRTLADLLARSYVVVGPARPPPEDADEREAAQADHRTRVRRIVAFEVVLVLSAIGLPWALTTRGGETTFERGERIRREALHQRFDADRANAGLAGELRRALSNAGLEDEARAVAQEHLEAIVAREKVREGRLRQQLAENPRDEGNARALIELLEEQERAPEASQVYRAWLGSDPEPAARLGFAQWLSSVGLDADAVAEARAALAEDALLPFGHTVLGVCLLRAGDAGAAQEELAVALLEDPDDEDARDALGELDEQLGPLDPARLKELARRLAALRTDGGQAGASLRAPRPLDGGAKAGP